MNCLEFRREVLVDPRHASDEGDAHAAQCAACAQFRAETVELDERIASGFAVNVPQGLADAVAREAQGRGRDSRRRFMALAASLVLATAVGAGAYVAARDDPFARAGIDFVVDEEVNAILSAKPADPAALQKVARSLNVELPKQVGEVRYIGTCPFQGTIAHHVVIITPEGKATLLLLPQKTVGGSARATARGLRAVVLPAGHGSLAIIADAPQVQRIQQIVVRSWPA